MTYTITPVFATPDVLYALYRGDGMLVKEFYDQHTAELAACHLDAIGDDPGGPEPPNDDIPGPGDPLPPAYRPLTGQALALLARLHALCLQDWGNKRLDRLETKAQRRAVRRTRKGI